MAPSLSDHIDVTIKRGLCESLLTFQNNDRSSALTRPPSYEELLKACTPTHFCGSVFALQRRSTGPLLPDPAALTGSLPLSCLESNRWIWSLRPSSFRTKTPKNKKNTFMNNRCWLCDLTISWEFLKHTFKNLTFTWIQSLLQNCQAEKWYI